jgi:type IV pilus assembly protein PilA
MKKHTTLKSKISSAFSLVELLVVIAVIAVIAAIAIPNIAGTREAATAAQASYDQATVDRMAAQVVALRGGTAPTVADLEAGVTVTNGTNVITFQLD